MPLPAIDVKPGEGAGASCPRTLGEAGGRHWPDVHTNIVDPGWVPTRMGGPAATDVLALDHDTQVWLATTADTAAAVTGTYRYHRQPQPPAPAVHDPAFQDQLLATLADITGTKLLAVT